MKQILTSNLLNEHLIEVRPISTFIDRKMLDEKPHRHPFQEIIFILSGSGKHTIDDEEFKLSSNTLYVIGEGQVHEFLEGQNLKGYLLRYKDSFLPSELSKFSSRYSMLQLISESNSLPLNKEEAKALARNFEDLILEKSKNISLLKNSVFQFLLLTLLSRINRKIYQSTAQSMICLLYTSPSPRDS